MLHIVQASFKVWHANLSFICKVINEKLKIFYIEVFQFKPPCLAILEKKSSSIAIC